jgi:hypothetical protein
MCIGHSCLSGLDLPIRTCNHSHPHVMSARWLDALLLFQRPALLGILAD